MLAVSQRSNDHALKKRMDGVDLPIVGCLKLLFNKDNQGVFQWLPLLNKAPIQPCPR